jgi:acyl carrier protein
MSPLENAPDSTPTLSNILSAIARHLDRDASEIDTSADLREELGLDALDLVLIVTRVEESLGVEVSLPRLDYVRTVSDLALVFDDADEPVTLRDPTAWEHPEPAPF